MKDFRTIINDSSKSLKFSNHLKNTITEVSDVSNIYGYILIKSMFYFIAAKENTLLYFWLSFDEIN